MSKCLVILSMLLFGLQACTTSPSAAPTSSSDGISKHMMLSGGIQRHYQLYRPTSAKKGAAAIFVLHGSTGSAESMRSLVGAAFERQADTHGFLVVYPDGYENHWNDCRGSADYTANTGNIKDTEFFTELVAQVATEQRASRKEMFVTGLSNGGQMTYKLALEAPLLFKGYAALIASLPEDRNLDCRKSNTPVSMMIINGTEDPVNPYQGGVVVINGNASRGPVLSSKETALYWAGLAGNRRPPTVKRYPQGDDDPSTFVEEKSWQKGNGYQIRLVSMHGSGHVFPHPDTEIPAEYAALLGKAAQDANGAELIVDFFLGL